MAQGQPRKMVVLANRNGFYYALDRTTGKFIAGQAVREADLGERPGRSGPADARCRTRRRAPEGTLIWPSLAGGSNWYSSTYNPKTDLYYVNVKEMGAIYIKGDAEYKAGAQFNGGGQTEYSGRGAVRRGARAGSGDRRIALGVQAARALALPA